MVVLDTDHVSILERENSAAYHKLVVRLDPLAPGEAVTTIISFEEQTRGWLSHLSRAKTMAQEIEAYRKLNRHLDAYREIRVLEFDEISASYFQRLRKARLRVGTMDLKIASIVLAHDAILLSRNSRDFEQVPGLKIEDWTT